MEKTIENAVVQTYTVSNNSKTTPVSSTDTYTYDYAVFEKKNREYYYNKKTTIVNGSLKTVYGYDKVKKESSRYAINTGYGELSTGFGKVVIQDELSRIYYTPINTILKHVRINADGTEGVLDTTSYTYDDNERILTERFDKSGTHYSETAYTYDTWSNRTSINSTEVNGDATVTNSIANEYYSNSFQNIVSLQLSYIKNLLKESVVSGSYTSDSYTQVLPTQTTKYEYNSLGQMTKFSKLLGDGTWAETVYNYYSLFNVSGSCVLLKSITSPTEHVTSFTYDYPEGGDYSITQKEEDIEKADGSTYSIETKKTYNFHTGNLEYYRDGELNVTRYAYDIFGRKTAEIRPKEVDEHEVGKNAEESKVQIDIIYDNTLLTTTHIDAMGAKTVYTFNKRGQLEQIEKKNEDVEETTTVNEKGSSITTLTYDGYGNIASIQDPVRLKITYGYDELQRLVSEKYSDSTDLSAEPAYTEKSYVYNDAANSRTTTRENGSTIYEAYDMSGNVIQEIIGGVKSSSYAYDNQGRLIRKVNGNGQVSTYTYDTRGNLKTETLPAVEGFDGESDFTAVSLVKTYTYDDSGNRTNEVYTRGDTTVRKRDFEYDGMGQLLKEINYYTKEDGSKASSSIKYSYNCNGQVLTVTDSNNVSTVKTYTPRGQVDTETFGGYRTVYDYDLEDRLISMSDPRVEVADYTGDFTIEYVYDDLDRLVKGTLPDRDGETPVVLLSYDARGNLEKRIEPDLSETSYTYTYRNWVDTETKTDDDNKTYITTYKYDGVGNRTSVTEQNTVEWVYEYDSADRLISETHPEDNAVIRYTYDGEDNLTGKTNGSGFWSYFDYDARSRLVKETDALGNFTDYDYDILGNRTIVIDPNLNEWKYQFDEMGRLTKEINSRNLEAKYTYDDGGRLKTLTDPNDTLVTYTYNSRNLPTAVSYVNEDQSIRQSESFTYDEAGSVKTATLDGVTKRYNYFYNDEIKDWEYQPDPYGLVGTSEVSFGDDSYLTMYGYDNMNRMNKLTYSQKRSGEYFIVEQKWGKLGQLDYITDYASDFTYDNMGRMSGYIQNNGVDVGYLYDDKSRLTELNYSMNGTEYLKYEYKYDLSDNMTTRNEDYFGYDRKDQLSCSYLQWLSSETEFPVKNFNLMDKQDDVIGEEAAEGFYFTSDDNATSGYDAISGSVSLDYAASSLVVDYAYPSPDEEGDSPSWKCRS